MENTDWEKRGYRIVPSSIDDLDLDYTGKADAEREKKWVITVLKEEADLVIAQLLLSQRQEILRECVEAMPEEETLPKTKCLNAENHLFGSCFQCEKSKGWNSCRAEAIKRLNKIV